MSIQQVTVLMDFDPCSANWWRCH